MGKPIYKELTKHLQPRSRVSDGDEWQSVALSVSKVRRQYDVRNCFGQRWPVMKHLVIEVKTAIPESLATAFSKSDAPREIGEALIGTETVE
jgi:hypothetical protein